MKDDHLYSASRGVVFRADSRGINVEVWRSDDGGPPAWQPYVDREDYTETAVAITADEADAIRSESAP